LGGGEAGFQIIRRMAGCSGPEFFGGGADDFFFPSPDGNNSNDTFLIIVSTERTDDFELTLEDISIGKSVSGNSETRGVAGINKYVPLTGEWFTSRFNIQIGK